MWKAVILATLIVASPGSTLAQTRKAPDLALKDLRGSILRLSQYRGKVVLLNFWATWCPPCRAEIPDLVRWQREYRDRGLQVIGITYPPASPIDVGRFVRGLGVNYPIVFGTRKIKLVFNKGETLPITVVIDRDGNIREVIEGILLPEEFEERIRPVLEQSEVSLVEKEAVSKDALALTIVRPRRGGHGVPPLQSGLVY